MNKFQITTLALNLLSTDGVNAGKKYQIDKKFFFQLTNVLNQITKFTSFLLKNIFLKKISIWYFFPALIPFNSEFCNHCAKVINKRYEEFDNDKYITCFFLNS